VKPKLDANLGVRGHRLLVEAGHDVSTAEVQGLARAADDALLATCTTEDRALVTLDTDFADAMRYPPGKAAGIVVLRTLPRATVDDIEFALRAVLAVVATAFFADASWSSTMGAGCGSTARASIESEDGREASNERAQGSR
jgi:predicted nuclease of predicted toxin-antitoxin system